MTWWSSTTGPGISTSTPVTSATARLVRVHNFDALYDMMRILLDPMNIFEELPKLDAPDLTGVVWPDHLEGRPEG